MLWYAAAVTHIQRQDSFAEFPMCQLRAHLDRPVGIPVLAHLEYTAE